MNDNYKKSILSKEIKIPIDRVLYIFPDNLPVWVAIICVVICFIHPVFITAFALKKQCIDYPYIYYKHVARNFLYPFIGYIGSFAIIISLVKKKYSNYKAVDVREHKTYALFVIMAILILISTCINGWDYWARFGTETMGQSVIIEIANFLILFPLAAMINNCKWKYILLRMFVLASTFLSVSAFFLWKSQIHSTYVEGWLPAFTCIHINTNYYGYYLAIAVSLSAAMICAETNNYWRYTSIICLIINTVALSYNNTMGAWIGGLFACIFLVITYRIRDNAFNRITWIVLAIFFVTLLITGLYNGNFIYNFATLLSDFGLLILEPETEEAMQAGSGRWIIWLKSMELIKEHPLFGIGFEGIFGNELTDYVGNNRPHNEYIEYTLFYGIPAGVVYFLGCISVYLRGLKYKERLDDITLAALTAAFGYMVSAFFGLTVYNTVPFLFIMMGLGYVHIEQDVAL